MPACARPGVYIPRQIYDCDAAVLVRRHLADFLARLEESGHGPLPEFVKAELEGFAGCGDFARGFVRTSAGRPTLGLRDPCVKKLVDAVLKDLAPNGVEGGLLLAEVGARLAQGVEERLARDRAHRQAPQRQLVEHELVLRRAGEVNLVDRGSQRARQDSCERRGPASRSRPQRGPSFA